MMWKTTFNQNTWDLDGFNDESYSEDLEKIEQENDDVESRVSQNEADIWNLETSISDTNLDVADLEDRVDILESSLWLTQTIVVKDSLDANKSLEFVDWILISIT